ncbi:MAG TPA: signal peptide peptidase SppA [Blastocatellia bacterium]|nr:signal peptide peptidase SppA [Blastocatellia bacterium]
MLFFGRKKKNRVAVVKVEGVIADNDSFGASRAKVTAALKEAERKKAKSIVLRVNSPGGSVAACQEIYSAIAELRGKGIPVVASMGDVAASGGVYISMAADEIIANPGTVTGSIGVIIRSSDLSDLYRKVGISPKVVKSGPHKDMLATYRSFSTDEQSLLQDLIADTHSQFVEVIANARRKSTEEVGQVADGRILSGRQAMHLGLIDALGGLDYAVKRAAALAGIKEEPAILSIHIRKGFLQRLFLPVSGYGQAALLKGGLSDIPLWLLPSI